MLENYRPAQKTTVGKASQTGSTSSATTPRSAWDTSNVARKSPCARWYLEFANTSGSVFEFRDGIESLARFGTEAKAAVPVLLSLLNDPRLNVRESVTNWLPRIDAEAAAKAGVKRPQ